MSIDVNALSPAEKLLWSHGFRKPEHIDLEGIAIAKGASVVYRCLDGCAARLLTDGDKAVISIAKEDNEGRQRFSLGHELAHWINDAKKASFRCASDVIGPQNAEASDAESQANIFASQLILPNYMVDPWMEGRKISLNVAKDMHDDFRSSITASAIKLAKRSTTPALVISHGMHGRRWYVPGRAWPTELHPKKELHHDTAAFDIVFKASSRMSTPRKEPAHHWLAGSQDVFRAEVVAQSMKLPDGSSLTMLVFQQAKR